MYKNLLIFFSSMLLLSCSGTFRPANKQLTHYTPEAGYRGTNDQIHKPAENTLLMLAFSGGGTRAAAFSYGVLKGLRDTPIYNKRLLDEVDSITAVSGGSFTAAYYGLFGDKIFEDFETTFLKQKVQRSLIIELFRPKNWFRLFSTYFSRSELAIEYYDNEIFKGATFKDLMGKDKPFIQINATDLAIGNRFSFNQDYFDLICSDISNFKIANAVAASSAVPVLFSSIILKNNNSNCEYEIPKWYARALNDDKSSRRHHNAKALETYFDQDRKFIHLVDGGISDNLGIRNILERINLYGGLNKAIENSGGKPSKDIAIILVNAETTPDYSINKFAFQPSLGKVIGYVTNTQIRRYNFETIALMKETLKSWSKELSINGYDINIHFIEINFNAIKSHRDWQFFNKIPTSFNLESEEVDKLISAGYELLIKNPEFQNYLENLFKQSTKPEKN